MKKISYVNGKFVDHKNAFVHIEDRGYQFSDGVYEVVYIKNNVALDWDLHCRRLQNSLDGLSIKYRVDGTVLLDLVMQLLQKNKLESGFLYLQISRGVAPRNHDFPNPLVTASLVATISPEKLLSEDKYKTGMVAITHADIRWKRRDLKTISLLPNILAKQKAMEEGAIESILIEENQLVTEGSSTNFFIASDAGTLRTHPANNKILSGITRSCVIEIATKNGIKIIEKPFKKDDIFLAKEAFITSTTKHIMPIVEVDGHNIGGGKVGEVTKKLIALYKEFVENQVEKGKI